MGPSHIYQKRKSVSPNLLCIHTDQQNCWTLSTYGGRLVHTPHIDSLARNGALFTNFFTNSAVCTPSRGSLLTGRYPHCHGAYINNIPLNRNEVTLAHVLQRNGYETGYAGKWHLGGKPRPGWIEPEYSMGFEKCRFMFNRGHWKKIVDNPGNKSIVFSYEVIGDETTYTTDWLTNKTIEFIKTRRSRPFFYMVSFPDPHSPYTVRAPYNTMFKPENMSVPSTFDQEQLPKWAEEIRNSQGYSISRPGREALLRQRKAQYCGEVKCIDDNVGRILDCLDEQSILNDTIVVFTTDHGDYMGEHGLIGKNNLYETVYHIPLIIRWSRRVPPGKVINQFVSTVDFQQTILGLMGIEPSGKEQGRDASPLLRGQAIDWQDEIFIHHSSLKQAGIFTPHYELAYVKDSDHIFFDRINDPEQINNLFSDPKYKGIIKELTARIIKHHLEINSPVTEWIRKL